MDSAVADAHGGKVNGDAAVASDGSPPPAPPAKTAVATPPADDAERPREHVSESSDEDDKGAEAKPQESEKDAAETSTSKEPDAADKEEEAGTADDQAETTKGEGDADKSTGDKDAEEQAKEQKKEEGEPKPGDDKDDGGDEEVPPTPSESTEAGDKAAAPAPDADASAKKSKGRGRPKAKQSGGAPKADKAPAKPRTPKTAPAPSVAPADSPAATAGRRERRTVERLQMDEGTSNKAKSADEPAGSGAKLGDIEYIEQQIVKARPDELKVLHRACYGRPGSSNELKRNLRKFNGFGFGAKSDEYNKKFTAMSKWPKSDMATVLKVLALDKGGSKEQQATRLLDYLLKPADSGKKKSTAAGGKRGRPSGSKKSSTPGDSSHSEHVESSDDDVAPPAKKPRGSPKASPVKRPTDSELKAVIKKMLTNVSLEDTTMKEMFKMVAAKFPKVDLSPRKDFIKQTVKAMIEAKA